MRTIWLSGVSSASRTERGRDGSTASCSGRVRLAAAISSWNMHRQARREPEGATVARFALHADLAAHQLDQLPANMHGRGGRRTCGSSRHRPGRTSRTAAPVAHRRREPDARVGDGDAQDRHGLIGGCAHLGHGHRDRAFGELDGVADQVDQGSPGAAQGSPERWAGTASGAITRLSVRRLLRAATEQAQRVLDNHPRVEDRVLSVSLPL